MEISVGAAAFWIALAAVLVAGGWWKSRSEAQKHETIRRIIEKTGQVDESKLKELFEPPLPDWVRGRIEIIKEIAKTQPMSDAKIRELLQPPPAPWTDGTMGRGDSYRALRGIGAVIMFIAVGILIAATIASCADGSQRAAPIAVLAAHPAEAPAAPLFVGGAVASVVAALGAGLFYASRFCEKPPPSQGDRA